MRALVKNPRLNPGNFIATELPTPETRRRTGKD